MRKALIIAMALASLGFGQTKLSYSYNGLPVRILPDSANVVSLVRIMVPRSVSITSVTATVQVQYSGVGDLNLYLYSPAMTRTKLLERNCGSLVNIDTTFDDAASTKYASFCPAEAGRGPYSANEPLANSRGQNSIGYWTLAVENNGSEKTGFVNGFSLSITGTALTGPSISANTIVNAASFKGGGVAPGELVGVFGVNLGPSGGISAGSSDLPTSLGGTTVTFDGAPAPVAFVADQVVVVQVPTSLTPGSNTRVQVQTSTGSTNEATVPILSAKPGLFTYEAGPTGQIKATNEDGTLNGDGTIDGSDKPAVRGSIIQVLACGLGPVRPEIPDGVASPDKPNSFTTLPVAAVIGGLRAMVTSAIAVPGQVGMYYVNVIVPARVPSGKVPMTISVSGKSSQDEATIQVK